MVRVDHFAFSVDDMDRAIQFYEGVIGLKLISREIDDEHGEEFTFMELEGGNLELLKKVGEMANVNVKTRGNCPHLAFSTEDMEKTVKGLEVAGVDVDGPFEIPGRVTWLYFKDPDGNILEYIKWLDDRS
ncbi:MAG: VOC family protein [Promethearchaeota archaeon]